MSTSATTTIQDSDTLLELLLNSLPSRQNRRGLFQSDMEDDELFADSTQILEPRGAVQAVPDPGKGSECGSMLAKIGALFTRLAATTTVRLKTEPAEEQLTPAEPEVVEHLESDREEELEVEYILLADKCVFPHPLRPSRPEPSTPEVAKTRRRRRAHLRPSSRRKTVAASAFPPVILPRSQPTKTRSKTKRSSQVDPCPGF